MAKRALFFVAIMLGLGLLMQIPVGAAVPHILSSASACDESARTIHSPIKGQPAKGCCNDMQLGCLGSSCMPPLFAADGLEPVDGRDLSETIFAALTGKQRLPFHTAPEPPPPELSV